MRLYSEDGFFLSLIYIKLWNDCESEDKITKSRHNMVLRNLQIKETVGLKSMTYIYCRTFLSIVKSTVILIQPSKNLCAYMQQARNTGAQSEREMSNKQ